jgi:two-component SAPR family response regulator
MNEVSDHRVRISCLGHFAVEVHGRPVRRWYGGRARNLFQYLLVNRNMLVLKERLRAVLWPHAEQNRKSSSLKVAVHSLRQVLDANNGNAGHSLEIVYQNHGYMLKTGNDVWLDFGEFERLVGEARVAESRGDTGAALATHERAVALYRGDFLVGETASWVEEQRAWLRASAVRSLHVLACDALAHRESGRALQFCRQSLEIEAYREETYRTIMLAHAMCGQRSEVQRWYDLCANRLRSSVAVEPSSETQRVLREALRGSPGVPRLPTRAAVPCRLTA